LRYG